MEGDNGTGSAVDRRSFMKLAGAGAVSASLAGCAGNSESGTDTEAGAEGGTATESDGGDQETEGGAGTTEVPEFKWLLVGSVTSLDPGAATDWPTTMAAVNYYNPLITIDPEEKKPVANIATEWTIEDDGTTWVFSLRDDVTFHNGDPLTAEDVAYSLNRIIGGNLALSYNWEGTVEAGGASARDESTVEIKTERPFGVLLSTLVRLFVVNSAVVEENAEDEWGTNYLDTAVAGSGPYTLPEPLSTGDPEELEYVAYEDYWEGWDENSFRRVRMQKVKEPSTIKSLMKNGEAHMTSPFLSRETYAEMDGYDGVSSVTEPRFATWHISMHTRKEPTDDLHVRKALAHAYDYQAAIENILGGEHAAGPVPVEMYAHNDDVEPYEQNLEKARAELEKSDYTVDEINEIGLEHAYVSGIDRQRKLSLVLQNSLSELGIEVKGNPLPWPQMVDRTTQQGTTPHMMNLWFGSPHPSPDAFLTLHYHPSALGTYNGLSWFTTDELTQLLDEARSTLDLEERTQLYREAQPIIADNYPGIYISNPPFRTALNDGVGGFQIYGTMGFEGQFHKLDWTG
jgi:peptide/nickel transport system substrate-binding protein